MHRQQQPVCGAQLLGPRAAYHAANGWNGEQIETFALVVKWLHEGKLNFDDYISARFPLREYRKALAFAADKRNKVIKVVLEPQNDRSTHV